MAIIFERRVGASTDDTLVYWDGSAWAFSLANVWHRAGFFSNFFCKSGGGMRFLNVTIPNSALITAAYIQFTCSGSMSAVTVKTVIIGHKIGDAATFSTLADYQARRGTVVGGPNNNNITAASVTWDGIPAWVVDVTYNSPDISSVVQEIVNLPAWASGNAMAIFWDDHADRSSHTGSPERRAYSWDGNAAKAPLLHVEYEPPADAVKCASAMTPKLMAVGAI